MNEKDQIIKIDKEDETMRTNDSHNHQNENDIYLNDESPEFSKGKQTNDKTNPESTKNPSSDANPDVSFSNQHSEHQNQSLNNFNVLTSENNNNPHNQNEKVNRDHDKNDLEINNDFVSIEKNNEAKTAQNPADTGFVKGFDSPKSSDYQLLNDNLVYDEDEIKDEIQAIDSTFGNLKQGEANEKSSSKPTQKDLDEYVMDEFPGKIKAENNQSNLNVKEASESNNSGNLNENKNIQSNYNKQQNYNNNQNQEDRNLLNLKVQVDSFLTSASEFCYRNDNESIEFFRDKVPNFINGILNQNMNNIGCEYLKVFFLFMIKYINLRIDFLEEMTSNEIYALLRITDQLNPIYMNYTSPNIQNFYTNEYYYSILSEILPQDKINNNEIYLTNWKIKSNPNNFYKIMMIFFQENDYISKFVTFLYKPFLDLEVFYNTYTTITKLIYQYYYIEEKVVFNLLKAVNQYYKKNIFANDKTKELQKFHFEIILKYHFFFVNQLSVIFYKKDEIPEEVLNELHELNLIDLEIINFLFYSNNLEKRVLAIRSLSDLIILILQHEKSTENSIKGLLDPAEFLKLLKFKKTIVLNWLDRINIFDILFGENIHEAILKKSASVLIFLYMNKKLPLEKIDYIWKMAQEKHEAISASIQAIFSELISYLSLDHVIHILKIINEIPLKEINDVTLKILESISNNKYLVDHSSNKPSNSNNNNNNILNNQCELNQEQKQKCEKMELTNETNYSNSLQDQNNHNQKSENFISNLNNNFNNLNEQAEENILDFIIVNDQAPSGLELKEICDFKSFYLRILWKFASGSNYFDGLSANIIAKSRKIFSQILLKPVFKNELIKYIKKSIIGIGLNQKLNTNLNFLENVLKNIKNYVSNNKSNKGANNNQAVNNNINPIPNNFTNQNEIDFLNNNLNILNYFSYEIKDFTELINYLEKNYQLTSTIFHAIVTVKKEAMYLADEIISVQDKIGAPAHKDLSNPEDQQRQAALKQTLLGEFISHYNEQITNINKHKCDRVNEINSFVNVQRLPNSRNIIENEMEIDLEDRENLKINSNFQVISAHSRKTEKPQKEYILSSNSDSANVNSHSSGNKKAELLDKDGLIVSNFAKNFTAGAEKEKTLKKENEDLDIERENLNYNINNNLNHNVINMDETLSTEKSFEDSISSYSTEISNLDKTKIFILKDFLEKNSKAFLGQINLFDNYELIFKNLKLNFQGQNYYQVVESLLEFLKFIIFSSTIQISQQQIEYLNVLLIENSLDEEEMNIFFNFFAEIFRMQQLTKQTFISDENLNYLLFDILLRLEIQDIPASGFNLFKQIFFYINTVHNNIKITSQSITDIKNFKNIMAFETLWKFYIETNNKTVLNEAKALLVNLISTISKNEENAEALIIIFQKVFGDLENILASLFNRDKNAFGQSANLDLNSLNCENINFINSENKILPQQKESEIGSINSNNENLISCESKTISGPNNKLTANTAINVHNQRPNTQIKLEEELNSLKKSEEKAIRLIKLLATLNSKQKLDKPKAAEMMTVNFQNSYFKDVSKKIPMQLPLDTKIKELKQIIISRILCPGVESSGIVNQNLIQDYKQFIDENSILLLYKGKILNNDKFTLKDYKFDNNGIVNIHKGENYSTEMDVDESTLREYISQVKFVFELEDEILKRALKKNNYKIEDTIIYLTDEANIASIQLEIQEENFTAVNDIESKLNIEIFKEKEVNMLLGFFNLYCESLSREMWELLAHIKYPANLISGLIDFKNIKFPIIFNTENLNFTLFNIKVINCLIFNDKFFTNMGKVEDSKKLEWKLNFISSDGIDPVIKLLSDCVLELENLQSLQNTKLASNENNSELTNAQSESADLFSLNKDININKINVLHQIIQILSKWVHYFTLCASYAIANLRDNLNFVLKQIVQNRPSGVKIGVEQNLNQTQSQINSSKDSSPSQTTPTFGSPHSSFSEGIKSTSFKQKCYLQLGMDENDTFLDEDSANKYFTRLIFSNFHLCLWNFFALAHKFNDFSEVQGDCETVFLNFLEILVIYNEMNPVAYKEFLINETEKSLIIDILFKEKSKNIRRIVENIFNILIQNKNQDSLSIKINNHEFKSTKEIIMMHVFNNYKKIFSEQVYEEFFNLFGSILSYDRELINSYFEDAKLVELSSHIIETIRSLSQKNDVDLSDSEQERLSGNIHLFQCLCLNYENIILPILEKIEDFNIINFFYKNLFSIENENENGKQSSLMNVRFKYSQRSLRQKTYDLLISFIKFKDIFKRSLGEKLLSHHTSFSNDYLEKIDINIGLRSSKDVFIGLFNYGCTCYLNSLMQQLYMIPQFRYNLFQLNCLSLNQNEGKDSKSIMKNYLDDIEMTNNEIKMQPENDENIINIDDKALDLDKNPVFQLQNLFANLSYSIKQYHSPMHFISSFKAFNNEPINVRIQQDCEEFLNILVDRLEGHSKSLSGQKDIFDDSFRGKISYEIISLEKEYSYYSETETPFLAISLDIKNKRTLEEALDLYIRGEVLEGENKYLVEKYNKKISILRRCSIKKLSKTVIIHLKRFEFDYNTFDKIKIIDHCAFPGTLDFKPWMRSSIISKNREDPNYKEIQIDEEELSDPDAFKYELTGVLVHSGSTADGGHYYSIIYDYETKKWFKFDDSRISEFNLEDLKSECFGEDKENQDVFSSRSQTAYLLFYTKSAERASILEQLKNMDAVVPESIKRQIKYENSLFLKYKAYLDNDYFKFIHDYIDFTVLKNKSIEKLIRKEQSMSMQDLIDEEVFIEMNNRLNKSEMIQKLDVNDQQQMRALKDLYLEITKNVENKFKDKKALTNLNSNYNISNRPGSNLNVNTNQTFNIDLKKKIIKLSIYFYFEIIVQQKDSYKMNSYSNFVRELMETDKRIASWFLKKMIKNKGFFNKMILENFSSEIRESMSRIVLNCILALYNEEAKYIKEEFSKFILKENEAGMIQVSSAKQYKSCVMRFFKSNIIEDFDKIRIHWSRFNQFLYIIYECFNSLLFELFELAINCDLFGKVVLMIMNNAPGYETGLMTMGTKNIEVNISLLIEILSVMVQSCITNGIISKKQYSEVSKYQGNKNIIEIPKNWELLLNKETLGNVILKKYTSENIIKMLRHLSWGDEKTSLLIINIITSTLKENLREIKVLNNLLLNSTGIFQIDDEIKLKRIRYYFCLDDQLENDNDSIFNYLLSIKDDLPLNCLFCLQMIGNLVMKNTNMMNYFLKFSNNLIWIYYFLKEISSNQNKQDNLQIEAATENINYVECFAFVEDLYLEKLKIKRLATSNQNIDAYARDEPVDSYYDFQQGIEMNTKIKNSNNNNDFIPDHPF